jgi:hypothetical protein
VARWLWLIVPGGAVILVGFALYEVWKRRQPPRVSSQWLLERRQLHGYEFARERTVRR